jgi:hypothetical protein
MTVVLWLLAVLGISRRIRHVLLPRMARAFAGAWPSCCCGTEAPRCARPILRGDLRDGFPGSGGMAHGRWSSPRS